MSGLFGFSNLHPERKMFVNEWARGSYYIDFPNFQDRRMEFLTKKKFIRRDV
jgi:hypothetical protein